MRQENEHEQEQDQEKDREQAREAKSKSKSNVGCLPECVLTSTGVWYCAPLKNVGTVPSIISSWHSRPVFKADQQQDHHQHHQHHQHILISINNSKITINTINRHQINMNNSINHRRRKEHYQHRQSMSAIPPTTRTTNQHQYRHQNQHRAFVALCNPRVVRTAHNIEAEPFICSRAGHWLTQSVATILSSKSSSALD